MVPNPIAPTAIFPRFTRILFASAISKVGSSLLLAVSIFYVFNEFALWNYLEYNSCATRIFPCLDCLIFCKLPCRHPRLRGQHVLQFSSSILMSIRTIMTILYAPRSTFASFLVFLYFCFDDRRILMTSSSFCPSSFLGIVVWIGSKFSVVIIPWYSLFACLQVYSLHNVSITYIKSVLMSCCQIPFLWICQGFC